MTGQQSAQLVTNCQPLATAATQLSAPWLTFVFGQGLTLDGHGRSMAQTGASMCACYWAWRGESCSTISIVTTSAKPRRFSGNWRL